MEALVASEENVVVVEGGLKALTTNLVVYETIVGGELEAPIIDKDGTNSAAHGGEREASFECVVVPAETILHFNEVDPTLNVVEAAQIDLALPGETKEALDLEIHLNGFVNELT